jgi:putative membrane protein
MMWGDGMGWWWFSILLYGVVFVGFVCFIIWAISRLGKGGGSANKNSPLDIAKERYARGEITKEEFEQMKKDLS